MRWYIKEYCYDIDVIWYDILKSIIWYAMILLWYVKMYAMIYLMYVMILIWYWYDIDMIYDVVDIICYNMFLICI